MKEPYTGTIEKDKNLVRVTLSRDGHFWKSGHGYPLSVKKSIVLQKGSSELLVDYYIEGEVQELFYLGVEFNFSFLGTGGERYIEAGNEKLNLATQGILDVSQNVVFHDPYQNINVSVGFDTPSFVWTHPVDVVSLSEHGLERNYQSTMLMPVWEIYLAAGPRNVHIRLQLYQAK